MNSSDIELPNCGVTELWRDDAVVVSCSGALDMLTSPHLDDRLNEVLAKQPSALIIDMTDVDFLASHGMNVLVTVRRRLAADVPFAVVADGPATSRPLTLIGLAELINMCATLEEAYLKLGIAPVR